MASFIFRAGTQGDGEKGENNSWKRRTSILMRNIRTTKMQKLGEKCIEALRVPPENRDRTVLAPLVAFVREMPDIGKLNLTTTKLEELCRTITLESYPRGAEVFHQGDYGDKYFIILRGRCVVRVAEDPEGGASKETVAARLIEAESAARHAELEKGGDGVRGGAEGGGGGGGGGAGGNDDNTADAAPKKGISRRGSAGSGLNVGPGAHGKMSPASRQNSGRKLQAQHSNRLLQTTQGGNKNKNNNNNNNEGGGGEEGVGGAVDEDKEVDPEKLGQLATELKAELYVGYDMDASGRSMDASAATPGPTPPSQSAVAGLGIDGSSGAAQLLPAAAADAGAAGGGGGSSADPAAAAADPTVITQRAKEAAETIADAPAEAAADAAAADASAGTGQEGKEAAAAPAAAAAAAAVAASPAGEIATTDAADGAPDAPAAAAAAVGEEGAAPGAAAASSPKADGTAAGGGVALEGLSLLRTGSGLEAGKAGKVVAVLEPRHGFGEMALFKNEPRSATIAAKDDLWVASITKESYLRIIAGGMVKALQEKLDFMKKLPVLRDMDPYALRNLSLCFQRLKVHRGSSVYAQGDDSDSVYVVYKGQCLVTTVVTAGGVPPPQPDGGGDGGGGGANKRGGGGNKKNKSGGGAGGGGDKGVGLGGLDAAAGGAGMVSGYRVETSHLSSFAQPKMHQVQLTMIGDGNMVGETEVLLGVPRFCTVVADSTEVELLKISSSMFLDKIPGHLLELIKAESLMKASFMAKRVSSATEFTWDRVSKEGSLNSALSPKPKAGSGGTARGGFGGVASPLSSPSSKGTFSSPGSMALAKMTLAEGLTGYAGEASGGGGGGGGFPGDGLSAGGAALLAPVVRHNREVSTARSVLRHSQRGSYNASGDPLVGTPFLGPGGPGQQQQRGGGGGGGGGHNNNKPGTAGGVGDDSLLDTILRSDDSLVRRGGLAPRGGAGKGSLTSSGSLTSRSHQHSSRSVLGTQGAVRSLPGLTHHGSRGAPPGRPMAAKDPKQAAKLIPMSQLDHFRPHDTIPEIGGGVGGGGGQRRVIAPGTKGPGWRQERLDQLTDHESGGSLRMDDPEDTANKMLGLERELRVRRMRALKGMKHADVASAETFLSSWLSGGDGGGDW